MARCLFFQPSQSCHIVALRYFPMNTATDAERSCTHELEVSVLIVNFNGLAFLQECIVSVERNLPPGHEIILVDNASSDGSAEFVRRTFPHVMLVESSENLGFTGGNNLAASRARGKFLLLLNNDTRVVSDIAPLLREFDDSETGVLGCRLLYADGRPQPSAGYAHRPLRMALSWVGLGRIPGLPSVFRRTEVAQDFYASGREVDWVSGAVLLTRRALWETLGGFDERYFMYVEDVDFCHRVRAAGYAVRYSPHATVIHYEGGGKAWIGATALRRSVRSYLLYSEKFHGTYTTLVFGVSLAAIMLLRAAIYGLRSVRGRSAVLKDKAIGYRLASVDLLKRTLSRTARRRPA
jgi:N-acetylglucosaminyl-diphospho-decaprenol L-rhamnosyltransferase